MALSSYIRSSFLRVADVESATEFTVEDCREHTFTNKESGEDRTSLCLFFTNGSALSLAQHHLRKLMELGYEEEEEIIGLSVTIKPGEVDYKGEAVAALLINSVA